MVLKKSALVVPEEHGLDPYRTRDLCPLQHNPESSGDDLNAGPLEVRSIFWNPGPESNWYRLRID